MNNYLSETIEDCVIYASEGRNVILNDGQIVGFEKNENPRRPDNQSGD